MSPNHMPVAGLPPQRRLLSWSVGLMAVLLAGCASSISARVTSFQQWSDSYQGQTYQIVTPPESRGNLEYAAYEDMLRAALGATGLVEARNGAAGRFLAGFDYQIQPVTAFVQEPLWWGGPGFGPGFGPAFGPGFGPGFGPRFYGPGFGYYGGGPDWVARPVEGRSYRLTVTIQDSENHDREVYRSTAEHIGSGEAEAVQLAPYLFRAVFDDFPGNNGQVRQVDYTVGR